MGGVADVQMESFLIPEKFLHRMTMIYCEEESIRVLIVQCPFCAKKMNNIPPSFRGKKNCLLSFKSNGSK